MAAAEAAVGVMAAAMAAAAYCMASRQSPQSHRNGSPGASGLTCSILTMKLASGKQNAK